MMQQNYIAKLVTVIIPAYNAGRYLNDTIASVFHQTHRPIELLLIDDGSTDDTKQIVIEWERKTIASNGFDLRYFYQNNSGAQVARNRGLDESKGEFIQYLDADDLIHESKIATQVNFLMQNKNCGYVYAYTSGINSKGAVTSNYPISGWALGDLIHNQILSGSFWVIHSGLYRRSLCIKIGPWCETINLWDDWVYSVKLGYAGVHIEHQPVVLSYYRIHENPDRISNRVNSQLAFKEALGCMQKIKKHMEGSGRHSRRERCLLSTSMMRLIPLAIKSDDTRNIEVVSKEIENLSPCMICKSRLRIMTLVHGGFGDKGYIILSKIVKKINSVSYKIWYRTLRSLGCKRFRAPRISMHL